MLPFDWLIEIISEIFILVNSKTFFKAYNIKIHVADKIFTSAKFEKKKNVSSKLHHIENS